MSVRDRVHAAVPAAAIHFLLSCAVAALAALLVWGVWFPFPYAELSGGRELFLLVVGVDIVCGPLLTLVVFNRSKPRTELVRDLGFISLIQMAALLYGLTTVYQVRPLYLVHEVDRFRVITHADYLGVDVTKAIEALDPSMQPAVFSGPRLVGTRRAKDMIEHTEVLLESMAGGRDISQRPDFYVQYSSGYALTVTQRARPMQRFVDRFPAAAPLAADVLDDAKVRLDDALFLPVAHRQDWIAILDRQGNILGFIPGDGFAVP